MAKLIRRLLGENAHDRALLTRRRACEHFGIFRYSIEGCYDILKKYLPLDKPGTFLEAGAFDGWTGSNTYTIEYMWNWRGILVEPVPALHGACRRNRPHARLYQCALVADGFPDTKIELHVGGLVSTVAASPLLAVSRSNAKAYYGKDLESAICVPARTLDSLIVDAGYQSLDFLSLDVEGFEAEALLGLDFNQRPPRFILVEANYPDRILGILQERYRLVTTLGLCDMLFQLK